MSRSVANAPSLEQTKGDKNTKLTNKQRKILNTITIILAIAEALTYLTISKEIAGYLLYPLIPLIIVSVTAEKNKNPKTKTPQEPANHPQKTNASYGMRLIQPNAAKAQTQYEHLAHEHE